MLQRFRQNKDLKSIDKYKPKIEDNEDAAQIKETENAFFKNNVQTEEQKEAEKKKSTEKARYLKALKALVQEKGQKMNPENGEIPALCKCGAQLENIKNIKKTTESTMDENIHLCASNC